MINKYGEVVILEDQIHVKNFSFDLSDGHSPMRDILEWAQKRIAEEVEKEKFKEDNCFFVIEN